MGGDHGPQVVMPALDKVIERRPDVPSLTSGRREQRAALRGKFEPFAKAATFLHCDVSLRMDDKQSQPLRQGRWKSPMCKAVEALKTGEAHFCVSAGNTGALMAMSKF